MSDQLRMALAILKLVSTSSCNLMVSRYLSGKCNLLGSVLSQQKFEEQTLKPSACHSSWTDRVIALRQISVTAPCYSTVLFRK